MENAKEHQTHMQEGPILNIVGEKVALGPLRRDLIPLYQRWINDFEVLRTLHIPRPSTFEEIQACYEADVAEERQRKIVCFTIYDRDTVRPIGRADIDTINYRDRTASFGIEIGEAAYRGRGYGTETIRPVLDYAFTGLGLHNILLETWEYNLAGQGAYKKAGFREIGRRHQAKFMNGKFWDIVYMECLSTGFIGPVLNRVLVPDKPRLPAEPEQK